MQLLQIGGAGDKAAEWYPFLRKHAESSHIAASSAATALLAELGVKDEQLAVSLFQSAMRNGDRAVAVVLALGELDARTFFNHLAPRIAAKPTRVVAMDLFAQLVSRHARGISDVMDTPSFSALVTSLLVCALCPRSCSDWRAGGRILQSLPGRAPDTADAHSILLVKVR